MNCGKCKKELKEKGKDFVNMGKRKNVSGIWQMVQCKSCHHTQKSECVYNFLVAEINPKLDKKLIEEHIKTLEAEEQTLIDDLCDKIDALPIELRKQLLKLKWEEMEEKI